METTEIDESRCKGEITQAEPGEPYLVERAQFGDHAAFAMLVERYQDLIQNQLCRVTGDYEVARDLTQDTFIRAYCAIGKTGPGLLVRPWLYRIAVNLAYNHLLRQRRLRWLPLRVVDRMLGTDHAVWLEERDLVRRALARLHPEERVVLCLCGAGDLSYAEAAVVLGGSVEALRKRFARAKARFRSAYAAVNAEAVPAAEAAGVVKA